MKSRLSPPSLLSLRITVRRTSRIHRSLCLSDGSKKHQNMVSMLMIGARRSSLLVSGYEIALGRSESIKDI